MGLNLNHLRLDEEMKQVPSAAHAHLWAGGFCYLYLGDPGSTVVLAKGGLASTSSNCRYILGLPTSASIMVRQGMIMVKNTYCERDESLH